LALGRDAEPARLLSFGWLAACMVAVEMSRDIEHEAGTDLPSFARFVASTALLGERCKRYLAIEGPARETFDYFMDRLALIRARYADLSATQAADFAAEVIALEEDASMLRHLLVGHCTTWRCPPMPARQRLTTMPPRP
jgi:hypothetical protein